MYPNVCIPTVIIFTLRYPVFSPDFPESLVKLHPSPPASLVTTLTHACWKNPSIYFPRFDNFLLFPWIVVKNVWKNIHPFICMTYIFTYISCGNAHGNWYILILTHWRLTNFFHILWIFVKGNTKRCVVQNLIFFTIFLLTRVLDHKATVFQI